ncbi:hypothetical protein TWF730_004873 [Orbilia blumenaviensis]|uniref:Uncharacterized protein n=1 Tax=Orbilia blumenaviensis TaxID=1796055 RepID=A0AAV9VJF0_9PEZI
MSKGNPRSLGRGGRRSLSDAHAERLGVSQRREARPPTRTVSLAAPILGLPRPRGKSASFEFQQRQVSARRSMLRADNDGIGNSQQTESQQECEIQLGRVSSGVNLPREALEPQADLSSERRKENVAPVTSQQSQLEFPASMRSDASDDEHSSGLSTPSFTGSVIRGSVETTHDPANDLNASGSSLNSPLSEELLCILQSMYANFSPDLVSNLEFLHAIDDAFDARYTAAFDVFYNTRRFFNEPSGTILDDTLDSYPVGSGTVSGKSIYGIFIDNSLFCELTDIGMRQPLSPPLLGDTGLLQRRDFLPSPAGTSQKSHYRHEGVAGPIRRLPGPKLSDSFLTAYSSLSGRRKIARRGTYTAPVRLRPTLRISPPRSPSFGMHKKTATLRPKAVMAWWKERDAANSQTETIGNEITGPHFGDQSKASTPQRGESEKKKEKEKRRNPLRRLSSLFGKRQGSAASLRSMAKSNSSRRSLNSLPSNVSLPQCRQGLQSFITANIVRNSRVPRSTDEIAEVPKARQTSGSSVVQQRISSFETPRPIRVEKKYRTSPSYQLLSTLKPVRGQALKEKFEKVSSAEGAKCVGVPEDIRAHAWEADPQPASVASPAFSGREGTVSTCQTPPIPDTSADSDSPQSEDQSFVNPPFAENSRGEGNSSKGIYDAELVLSSPDFSDPQIVMSTPCQNGSPDFPLVPQSISILGDSPSSRGLDSSIDSIVNSSRYHSSMIVRASGAAGSFGSDNLGPSHGPLKLTEKMYQTIGSGPPDENKENIAPSGDLLNLPTIPPPDTRRISFSSILGLSRGQRNARKTEEKPQGPHRGWGGRPLRLVKSAWGPFGVKDTSKSVAKGHNDIKKRRQSVLDLFRFSRAMETTNLAPIPGTPSFRVLPTVGPAIMLDESETPIQKNKSILSMKLGRKKKPILAVPKYPKKDRLRGNLFGLFEFNKATPKNTFTIHSDAKETAERRASMCSNTAASKVTRHFSMSAFPAFKGRIFSGPPGNQNLPPKPEVATPERPISPPPQLELNLPGSCL